MLVVVAVWEMTEILVDQVKQVVEMVAPMMVVQVVMLLLIEVQVVAVALKILVRQVVTVVQA